MTKFKYVNGHWINTETNKVIPLGNRIKSNNGDYIQYNSDGSVTKIYDSKTGQTAKGISASESNLMRQGWVKDANNKWRPEVRKGQSAEDWTNENYNYIISKINSDKDYLKSLKSNGINISDKRYTDKIINQYGALLFKLYSGYAAKANKDSTGYLRNAKSHDASIIVSQDTYNKEIDPAIKHLEKRNEMISKAKNQYRINNFGAEKTPDYEKMSDSELNNATYGQVKGASKVGDILGKSMFYGTAAGLGGSTLIETVPTALPWITKLIPWITASIGADKGLDKIAGNSESKINLVDDKGNTITVNGIVDKNGNLVGKMSDYLDDNGNIKDENGSYHKIISMQNLSGIPISESDNLANNRIIRTGVGALAMSGGNLLSGLGEGLINNVGKQGLKSILSTTPKNILNDQILFHSMDRTQDILGNNFTGKLAGFTIGNLLTRKYSDPRKIKLFFQDIKTGEIHRPIYNTLTTAGSSIPLVGASYLGDYGSLKLSEINPELGQIGGMLLNAGLLHHSGKISNVVDRGSDMFKTNLATLTGSVSKPGPVLKTIGYNLLGKDPSNHYGILDFIKNTAVGINTGDPNFSIETNWDLFKNNNGYTKALSNLWKNFKYSTTYALDTENNQGNLSYLLDYIDLVSPEDRLMPKVTDKGFRQKGFFLGYTHRIGRPDEKFTTTNLTYRPSAELVINSPAYKTWLGHITSSGNYYDSGKGEELTLDQLPEGQRKYIESQYPLMINDGKITLLRTKKNVVRSGENEEYILKEIQKEMNINPSLSYKDAEELVLNRFTSNRNTNDELWNEFWNDKSEPIVIGETSPISLGEKIKSTDFNSAVNTAGHNVIIKIINGIPYKVKFDFHKWNAGDYDNSHVNGSTNEIMRDKSLSETPNIFQRVKNYIKGLTVKGIVDNLDNGLVMYASEVTPLSDSDFETLMSDRRNVRQASKQITEYERLKSKSKLTPKQQQFIDEYEEATKNKKYDFSESLIQLLKLWGVSHGGKSFRKYLIEAHNKGQITDDEFNLLSILANKSYILNLKHKDLKKLSDDEFNSYSSYATGPKAKLNFTLEKYRRLGVKNPILYKLLFGSNGKLLSNITKEKIDIIRSLINRPIPKLIWDDLPDRAKKQLELAGTKHLKLGGSLDKSKEIVNKVNNKLKFKTGGKLNLFIYNHINELVDESNLNLETDRLINSMYETN